MIVKRFSKFTQGGSKATKSSSSSWRLTNLQSLTFGVIQEAKPAKEAKPAEEATPVNEVKPMKEPEPAKEAEPAEKVTVKEAEPATSHIGLLPKLLLAEHHDLLELYLLGQLNKPIWTQLLPVSLRVLTLSGSMVEADVMPKLGGLLRNMRTLTLSANSFLGTSLTFIKDGFPSLIILKIWKLPNLQAVNIEPGAMLHLKELEFGHLDAMKNVVGTHHCTELETICVVVKKGAHSLLDHLEEGKGETTNLYKIERD